MDFGLYARVLWRFKPIVVLGLVLAVALAGLSVVRVSGEGIAYRDAVLWSSSTRIGVTQQGFPWGRLLAQEQTPGEAAQNLGIPQADPNRLNTLAVLYAELATSDPVRDLLEVEGAIPLCDQVPGGATGSGSTDRCGKIVANPVVVGDNRVALPLVDLMAIAPSPAAALDLAQKSADAFRTFIREQQKANDVPSSDRVVVQQLVRPNPPKVFQPRSKTLPIVVFLAVMFATVGIAFLLENVRPRGRQSAEPADPALPSTARRTA